MSYYRSTAYTISQGFQKVLIYYFMNFLRFTMNFQSSCKIITNQSLRHYSHESQVLQKGPSLSSNSSTKPPVGKQSRGAAGSRLRPAVGVDGGGGVAGEDQGSRAHTLGCSIWLEAGRVGLAARTGVRGGHGTGGHANRRRRKAGKERTRPSRGRRSRWQRIQGCEALGGGRTMAAKLELAATTMAATSWSTGSTRERGRESGEASECSAAQALC